jgi:hypothetical protein
MVWLLGKDKVLLNSKVISINLAKNGADKNVTVMYENETNREKERR